MRVGLFGGSFDPIHVGHLVIAQEALWQIGLDRLVFVPTAHPPHKPRGQLTPIEHRMAMVKLAIEGLAGAEVAELEAGDDTAYTVDTLRWARSFYGSGAQLVLVIGGDSLRDLQTWRDPDEIAHLARLAVYDRSGCEAVPASFDHDQITGPLIDVSSTWIRRRIADGEPVRYWVPSSVQDYLERHRLYRARTGP